MKLCLFKLILYLCLIQCGTLYHEHEVPGMYFTILHNNDIMSRFEETDVFGNDCESNEKCYGGISRVIHEIKKVRESGEPMIYLNAGGTFDKNAWFLVHKQKIVVDFLNLCKPVAVALGSPEFDDGLDGLGAFVTAATFPILAANIDDSTVIPGIKKFTTIILNNHKIGIVGYISQKTKNKRAARNLTFLDEIRTINKETKKMKELGVKTIIALGYSGFGIDKKIAKYCDLVDIVIGGMSYTFLWPQVNTPSIEIPEGDYPFTVRQKGGRTVYVLQAYKFTKYLGKLKIYVNRQNGSIMSTESDIKLLSEDIPEDKESLELLKEYRKEIDKLKKRKLAVSHVVLDGKRASCRRRESNFGNLVTDSFIDEYVTGHKGEFWTNAPIAVLNSGALRRSIDVRKREKHEISELDLVNALSVLQHVVVISVNGSILKQILELSAQNYGYGGFLQYSGVKVKYNRRNKKGEQVVYALVRCSKCQMPQYKKLNLSELYTIMVPEFIAHGGDGYTMIKKEGKDKKTMNVSGRDCIKDFMMKKKIIFPEVTDRILFTTEMEAVKNDNIRPSDILVVIPLSYCTFLTITYLYLYL